MQDIARFCNRFPDIEVKYGLNGDEPMTLQEWEDTKKECFMPANSTVALEVELARDQNADLRPVDAPR